MGAHRNYDWAKMTVADVAKLSEHDQQRYLNWLEGKKIRKKNSNSFNDDSFSEFLNKSCTLYTHGSRV